MRTTIDMPDYLIKRVKQMAAERKTTVRALVVDALEQMLSDKGKCFQMRDASVGTSGESGAVVSGEAINTAIDRQRESRFIT